jgi:hypothetical protein
MARKALIAFLIKIFPLFFVILLLWQFLKFSHAYMAAVAAVLDVFFPLLDPTGIVKGFDSDGIHFIIHLTIANPLKIVGEDITSNTAMLLSLYLASPIRHYLRKFTIFFTASILILFFVHCFTVSMTILYAFTTNPDIMRRAPVGLTTMKAVDNYVYFYELVGMYLIILALWFPYIGSCLAGMKRRNATDEVIKQKHPA